MDRGEHFDILYKITTLTKETQIERESPECVGRTDGCVSVKRLTMMDDYAWCVWVKPIRRHELRAHMWPPVRAGRTVAIVASVQNTLPKHDPRSTILPTSANFSKLLTFSPTKTEGPYEREKEEERKREEKRRRTRKLRFNLSLLYKRNRFSSYASVFFFFFSRSTRRDISRNVHVGLIARSSTSVERIRSQWSERPNVLQRIFIVNHATLSWSYTRVDSGVWVKGYQSRSRIRRLPFSAQPSRP